MLNTTQSDPSQRLTPWLMRHWLLLLAVPWTLYVSVPWLAPVAMQLGARQTADAIYTVYSTQCHQLPERSYFLFGPKTMYSLDEIQAAFLPTNDPLVLRQFNGNETMGWKVAWSDRMVSLYGGIWLAMVLFALVGRRLPRLPVWAFALMLLPMLLDGGSHFLSDVLSGGVGAGFRDSNAWLAALSGQTLPAWFVTGDALGSFNWSLRLLTGLLMAVAVVWFVFPLLDDSAAAARYDQERAQRRAGQSA